MTEEKEIFDYLIEKARTIGVVPTRNAADKFLKLGLKAVVEPTKRQVIPRDWVKDAWGKQKGVCSRCHKSMALYEATGDHTIAITQGGEHKRKNITAMHRICNSSKGDKDIVTEVKRSGNLMNEMFNENEQ